MSIRTVVTRGFSNGGSIALVTVRGYAAEAAEAADDGSTVYSYGRERQKKELLADDDDAVMAVIVAFLQIKDD